ncbi:MAG: RluA family pseudouridine synthase [Deltaproteobacteria bacterium]|nr:RluA family pseudouridine synthase [Deltaproteobacteria bacterium]
MESRQFIVNVGESGHRIDRWLTQKMPNLSRGQIKHLLDHGKVLVNHRRVLIAGWELESNDAVEVRIPDGGVPEVHEPASLRAPQGRSNLPRRQEEIATVPAGPRNDKRIERVSPESIVSSAKRFLEVLYEDRDIIVVNKPAGVLTEPKGDSPHDHLLGMIKGYLKRKHKESRGSYIKLLHRLDKDTSGVIVAAKSKVGEQLEDQFRGHRIERNYIAIVEGRVDQEEGVIDLPLEKGEFEGGKKSRVAHNKGEGKEAITRFRVKERYSNATQLSINVGTGRTHQVRVHLSEKGHPLIGDHTYGSKIRFPRHALHATLLAFKHPRTGKQERFETKLPQDLEKLIDQLRVHPETVIIGNLPKLSRC